MVREIKRNVPNSVSLIHLDRNGGEDLTKAEVISQEHSLEEIQLKLNTWLTTIKVPLRVIKIEAQDIVSENKTTVLPNKKMLDVLLKAYSPCVNIGVCREAKFDPLSGHVPRGFLGCTGNLEDVKVIFVFAEPGHPHQEEKYTPGNEIELLSSSG